MDKFIDMGLPAPLMQCLTQHNFTTSTPIQAQTIPYALKGRDILGSSQTGSGKTLSFTIPMIAKLLNDSKSAALVLTPTRELAQQVMTIVNQLVGRNPSLKTALLIGGEPYSKQLMQLKRGARIIVGTPGRVIDHMGRGTLYSNNITTLVLDETDRMLDMGFGIQLDQIIQQIPSERQTLMFSATFLPRIEKLAANYLNNPERIFMTPSIQPIKKIQQETINVKEADKFSNLIDQLNQREGSIIVFVKTKISAEKITNSLLRENHNVSAIHGDLRQKKRDQVMRDFRKGNFRIMIATDVAARGLDVPEIRHVINYNLPHCPEDYVHRIGRTARNGAEGAALNLVSPSENKLRMAIERFLDPTKKQQDSFGSSSFSKSRKVGSSFGDRKSRFGQRPARSSNRDSDYSKGFGLRERQSSSENRTNSFSDRRPGLSTDRYSERTQSENHFNRSENTSHRDGNRFESSRSRAGGYSSYSDHAGNKTREENYFKRERNFNSDRLSSQPRESNSWDKPSFNREIKPKNKRFGSEGFKSSRNVSEFSRGHSDLQNNQTFFRDFGESQQQRPRKVGGARPFSGNAGFKKPSFTKKRP